MEIEPAQHSYPGMGSKGRWTAERAAEPGWPTGFEYAPGTDIADPLLRRGIIVALSEFDWQHIAGLRALDPSQIVEQKATVVGEAVRIVLV